MTALPRAAAMLLAVAGSAHAVTEAQLQPALQPFTQATAGQAAPAEAVRAFAALRAHAPSDPLLLAYEGAATAMQARDAWLPWKKIGYAEDGLALIDKALALLTPAHQAPGPRGVPTALEVKLTAASTFLALPKMMNRHERGQQLLAEVLHSPLLAAAPLPFQGQVWLTAADEAIQARRPVDARRQLQQVIASGAPQAAQAQARLQGLRP